MSREDDRRPMPELVAELITSLQALLERAADQAPPGATVEPDPLRLSTSWQKYANELRDRPPRRRVADVTRSRLELAARLARREWGDGYAMRTRCSGCSEIRECRGRRRRRMLCLECFDLGREAGQALQGRGRP